MKKTFFTLVFVCFGWQMNAQQRLDVGLEEIFNIADQNSRQIRISTIGVEASGETVKSAKSSYLPDVNFSLSGSFIGTASLLSRGFSADGQTTIQYAIGEGHVQNGAQPTPHWGNDFVAQVTQVIYAGGMIKTGVRLAELGEKMAVLDVEKNRQDVRFLLTGQYLELCKLNNQLEVVRKNKELTDRVLSVMRASHEQGTVLKNDITRYELQLQSLQLSETQLLDAISIMNHQLVTTLHLNEDAEIVPKPMISPVESPRQEYWYEEASRQNLPLQQARLASEISETEKKAVRASQMPTIALFAEDHLGGPFVNDFIPVDANVNAWFIGIGIKYNLSNLWHKNHDIKKAEINARQSDEKVELVSEKIKNAVQADYVNFQTSFVEVETQRKQVELASQHYDVTQNRYINGLALLTDMLDASNMKLNADMMLVNAQISLAYNYYKLKYITGSL